MAATGAAALEAAWSALGPFGLYQGYVLLLVCVPNLLAPMYALNYVFVADRVPYRCLVPECEGAEAGAGAALQPGAGGCERYRPPDLAPGNLTCDPLLYDPDQLVPCDSFLYENLDTTFAEFNLACREWRRTLVGSLRNAALPLALALTGYVSDVWGRRTAFCVFSAFMGLLGLVKSVSINYPMYIALEFLEAALGYGFTTAAYVLLLEVAAPAQRAVFACATGAAYGAGGVLLALLARTLPGWRDLLRAAHAPALLLPLYWLLLDESARWLLARRRPADAVRVLRKAARWNKVTLDEDLVKCIVTESDQKEEELEQPSRWLGLLRSRVLLGRFAVCCWCWIASSFVYYGLTINSVSLPGDKYTNFGLNMAMDIVASLLLMMTLERFGRKRCIFVSFMLCGIACVLPFFIDHTSTGLGMYFVGKLGSTCAFNSVYVFTAELFPTAARSSALSACSLVGRVGSILAPQTPLLSASVQALLYGACSLSAALVVLLAPETRGAALPADTAAAERVRGAGGGRGAAAQGDA